MLRSAAILILSLVTFTAQASLIGRAALTLGGTDYQAYYDTDLNITWLADASTGASSIYDDGYSSADGRMSWNSALGWIAALNAANYLGTNHWRLPWVTDTGASGCDFSNKGGTDCGYNVDLAAGEMAHMFYSTLGNTGAFDTNGSGTFCYGGNALCLANAGPFSDIHPGVYWSGTQYPPIPQYPGVTFVWDFGFGDGRQGTSNGSDENYVWAVTDGDAFATVPVPAAVYLFGSALGLVGVMRRKVSS